MALRDRIAHAWNAFTSPDEKAEFARSYEIASSSSYGSRPDRQRILARGDRTILASIYTRLAIDVSGVSIKHVRLDDEGRYLGDIKSGLNECLNVRANLDQAARHFRQDIAMTLFDKGVVAIVATDTSMNPLVTGGYDILSLRVGEVVTWFPQHVRVKVYNERRGVYQEIDLDKRHVAIIENPLYSVMNEPNSTLQRLIRKMNLIDNADEQTSSGKLDMIIQLPYVIKTDARREQAEQRREDIELQLKGSKYGIAYTDGTEKITQLNRPVENNLQPQIEYLIGLLYSQLGLTPGVMNGTASEQEMRNYMDRVIEPILDAISEGMLSIFLTKTARSQNQSIAYFKDPFKLVPMSELAEIVDKFTRNEVMTGNEIRTSIGIKPSKDPKADELRNSNMPQPDVIAAPVEPAAPAPAEGVTDEDQKAMMDDAFEEINKSLDDVFKDLGVDPYGDEDT